MDERKITDNLIKKAANGNMRCFEKIYKLSSDFVYNVALRTTSNPEDAAEITQDVYMKLYSGLQNFERNSSFKTWLYRITVNTSYDYLRKRKSRSNKFTSSDKIEAHDNTTPRSTVLKNDKQNIIENLMNSLSEDHRICIMLRELHNLSYEEIADALSINVNTVRSRLKRARDAFLKVAQNNEVIDELR